MSDPKHVHIFWDESAGLANGATGLEAIASIAETAEALGTVQGWKLYSDSMSQSTFTPRVKSGIQASGVSILEVAAEGREGGSSKILLSDVFIHAFSNALSVLVVVTADPDILYGLSLLKAQGSQIQLICPPDGHQNLIQHSLAILDCLQQQTKAQRDDPRPVEPPPHSRNPRTHQSTIFSAIVHQEDITVTSSSSGPLCTPSPSGRNSGDLPSSIPQWKGKRKATSPPASVLRRSPTPSVRSDSHRSHSTFTESPVDFPSRRSFSRSPTPSPAQSHHSTFVVVPKQTEASGIYDNVGHNKKRVSPALSIITQPRAQSPEEESVKTVPVVVTPKRVNVVEPMAIPQPVNEEPPKTNIAKPSSPPPIPPVAQPSVVVAQPLPTKTIVPPTLTKESSAPIASSSNQPTPPVIVAPAGPSVTTPAVPPQEFQVLIAVLREWRTKGYQAVTRSQLGAALLKKRPNYLKESGVDTANKPFAKYIAAAFAAGVVKNSTGDVVLHPTYWTG